MNDKTLNVIKIFCRSLATSLLRGILLVAGIMLLIACGKPGQSDDPTAEYEALKTDVPPGTAKMEQFYLGAGFTVSHSDSSRVTYRFIEGKKSTHQFVVNNFTSSKSVHVKVNKDTLSSEQKAIVNQIKLNQLSGDEKSQRWELEWTPQPGFIPENATFRDLAISLWIGSDDKNFIEEPLDLFVTKPEDDLIVHFVDLNNDTTILCNGTEINFSIEVSSRSGSLRRSPQLEFLSPPDSSTTRSEERPLDLKKYVTQNGAPQSSDNGIYVYKYSLEIRQRDTLLNGRKGFLTVQALGPGVSGVSFTVLPNISCPNVEPKKP
ncbi:MAG: hypothetical protein K1X29_03475 [Bdellovibrionales bacterium]|nr:hypothetical protein [Bdellovibrionales bacterium]